MNELEAVLCALGALRCARAQGEYDLHARVRQALEEAGLPCQHEAPLSPRRRVDFLCGGVAIEVKRGRPGATPLLRQLSAYAQSPLVSALVLVSERVPPLPETLCGKPLRAVCLQRLWGIAL